MNKAISFGTKLLANAPSWTRDLAVTIGSSFLLRQRRGGAYRQKLAEHRGYRRLKRSELLEIQARKLRDIIDRARSHSAFYRSRYAGIENSELRNLPILEKEDLQGSIDSIVIGRKDKLHEMFTGGTTGRGIVVYNHISNMQERAALIDLFWQTLGYTLGQHRIAWFSGRTLLEKGDVRKNRFWRTNWLDKIRYYSTFHFSQQNLPFYVQDLNTFQPEFITGFPSAISEIARFIEATRSPLTFKPKAIFVTSETLTDEQRSLLSRVFGCRVANQYSSSEGAPWIVECERGRLHMDITTGVFEVIDENGDPAIEGEILVTSFVTRETPIIRYRIGDRIRLASPNAVCDCGWDTPLADAILGRATDYVEVPERGRIFNSQIGDCVKDVTSVMSFQVEIVNGRLEIDMMADPVAFERHDREVFLKKIRERVGDIPVDINFVSSIPRAASGKQTLVRRRSSASTTS